MPGPQPLDPVDRRRWRVGVWLSDRELDRIAALLGRPDVAATVRIGHDKGGNQKACAAYLRSAALGGRRAVPQANREAFAALARVGNNLNQLVGALNACRRSAESEAVLAEARAVLADIADARARLLDLPAPGTASEADDSEQE